MLKVQAALVTEQGQNFRGSSREVLRLQQPGREGRSGGRTQRTLRWRPGNPYDTGQSRSARVQRKTRHREVVGQRPLRSSSMEGVHLLLKGA